MNWGSLAHGSLKRAKTRTETRRNCSLKPWRESFWGRAAAGLRRCLGALPKPYFTDHRSVEHSGSSSILEFPVFYNILDIPTARHRWLHRSVLRRATASPQPVFLSLFFHIDE